MNAKVTSNDLNKIDENYQFWRLRASNEEKLFLIIPNYLGITCFNCLIFLLFYI